MFISCNLAILILALTLEGQVRGGEIIGGSKTKHRRPYMVLVELQTEENSRAYCGGFLLNDEFVMTAAHCQASSYKVLLGLLKFNDQNGVQYVSVEKTFIHEQYDETDYKNDLMLLKLSSKVVFTEKVKPIALAEQSEVSQPKSCMIFGWGKTDRNNKHLSPNLMEGSVTLLDNEQCPRENSYCSEGEVGLGEGDSGGPLVCEDEKAYGIVSASFEPNSGSPMLHVYVKIPDYRTWIDSIIKNP